MEAAQTLGKSGYQQGLICASLSENQMPFWNKDINCACIHPDEHVCLRLRSQEEFGIKAERLMDEECNCLCHDRDPADFVS